MRSEKFHLVSFIGSLLKDSDYVYFISFQGMTVKDVSELRNKLSEVGAGCHVLKNALISKAAELNDVTAMKDLKLTEGTALVCGKGDASTVAKVISEFGKTHEQVKAKGGLMDGALLSVSDVAAIADLPSKDALRSQLLSVLQGPARNLASLLNNKAASILNVLNAYKDKLDSNN